MTPSDALEPNWEQLLALGFIDHPDCAYHSNHAVEAFKEADNLTVHQLTHRMSETLFIGTHTNKFTPSRIKTVISEAEICLIK